MWRLLEGEELENPVSLSGETEQQQQHEQHVSFISAFVVRFLTRRFIGDYSSSICSAYPHTVTLDNSPVAVIVWDTPALSSQVRHCRLDVLVVLSQEEGGIRLFWDIL